MDDALKNRISGMVDGNRVVLFMKGTRHFPQCGFSAPVTQILDGLVSEYQTVNVLKDPDIRQGIKEYSNWPTIPQLYVDGKLVGGCDIVREMYVAGELQELLGVEENIDAPQIDVSDAAKSAFADAMSQDPAAVLRLEVSPRFEHELSLDAPKKGDFSIDSNGVRLVVDRDSAKRANGLKIDYVPEGGGGFKIDNPNEPARVKQLAPTALKAMMDADETFELVDVRTDEEREIAAIAGSRLLDQEGQRYLEGLEKSASIVFFCHHGGRSQAAAEHFLQQGFTKVYNLAGGIDAWSQAVDPKVARY